MRYILLFILALLSSFVFSQERDVKALSAAKRHKIAKDLNKSGGYYESINHTKELLEKDSTNDEYLYTLAEAYFLSRDYVNAEIYFKKVAEKEGKNVSLALFRLAESQKYNGKYAEAKNTFDVFQKSKYKEARGEKYKLFAKNEVSSCDFAIKALHDSAMVEIVHLGDNVNSGYTEFSPRPLSDSVLIFASLQSDSVLTVDHGEMHYHHVKLYSSENKGEGWEYPEEIKELNTNYESNANGVFSPDMTRFYFTRCYQNNDAQMICEIYVSNYENGTYQKPQKLDDNVNIAGFTSTQPYIFEVPGGKVKTETLLFTSNRPGGKGGLDIWSCTVQGGKYKKPTNMGPIINSIRDEMSPYYDQAYECIYFSSNYHHGFGGYDIFRSLGRPGKWDKPVNIGVPFNTRVDDTYFIMKKNKRDGFLVSNRPGGIHLTSETCCDDIYSFKYDRPLIFALNPLDEKTLKKNDGARVTVLSRKLEEGENLDSLYAAAPTSDSLHNALATMSKDSVMKVLLAQITPDSGQGQIAISSTVLQSSSTDSLKLAALRIRQLSDSLAQANARKYVYDTIYSYRDNIYNDQTQKQNPQSIYQLEANREYRITVIVPNTDSALVVFYTDAQNTIHIKEMSTKVNKEETENENIRIMSLKMLMKSNTTQVASKENSREKKEEVSKTKEVVKLSDYTITKAIEEKESKNAKKGTELKVILNYDFDDVSFFEVNHGSLDSLVYLLKKYPELKIKIDAHTDNKGTEKYNLKLSERRAVSIKEYLNKKGIDDNRMKSKGFGEKEPIASNENEDGSDNPEGRQINRRAEIIIVDSASPAKEKTQSKKSKG